MQMKTMRGRVLESVVTGVIIATATACVSTGAIAADPVSRPDQWTGLSLSTCGVAEFLAQHPESDGRGVVIAVLDTGVDPSIPGLTHTPDGEVKVIDVQDFAGQGDVDLHRVRLDETDGKLVDYDDDGAPIHYELPAFSKGAGGDEERRFWFGVLNESRFVNSEAPDLNNNGETDDEFPICVTALSGDGDDQALCLIDTDMDRSFADEKPLRNYRLAYDTFTLAREKPEKQIIPLTFAVNIFLRKPKVSIVYDDGSHGTHVAGIAAGYRINNQDGFNGVAPGAKVMGLKIAQNGLGGVTTTDSVRQALEYAARYAREHDVPVVCNMSFGVESVVEGHADIDKVVDEVLAKNPYMMFLTSAGNEGPGLSTVGTPAAAKHGVSVAALLAAESARDVMGIDLQRPVLTAFSSRGGEVDKPDLATPGWCTSTVPRYVTGGDYWAGTSMASPYAAGMAAVLISDALAKHADRPVRGWDVRRALCLSGRPVDDATPISIGYGMPDLPVAAELLGRLVKTSENDPIIGYDISTPCPHGYNGKARAAYWRSTYFPTSEQQTFTISPIFAPNRDAAARTSFTRKFQLRSTAPWCKLTQNEVYLRSEQTARVHVTYDETTLTAPGIHVGTVEALHDGLVAFRLVNTIVVPHRARAEDDFKITLKDQIARGWEVDRHFVVIPAGTSVMRLTLSAPEGKDSKARFDRIFDPNGAQYYTRANRLDSTIGKREVVWTFSEDLIPGVWEIPVIADRPDREWPYRLDIRFFGLHAAPAVLTDWSGDPLESDIVVTNLFEDRLAGSAAGQIEGFRLHKEDEFKGLKDTLTYTLELTEACDRVRYDIEMTPEAYATTTDIGVAVEADGEEINFDAFSNRKAKGTVSVPGAKGGTTVKLIIRAGFAVSDDDRKTPITVRFDQLLTQPVAVSVTQGDESNVNFVPSVPIKLSVAADKALPPTPDGLRPVGRLRFTERGSKETALVVPIDIGG